MNKFFLIVLLAFVMTGCQSYKKVPYLQDAEAVSHGVQNEQLYDAKIMPKDLLTIVVSCTSPELAAPFNLIQPLSQFCSNIWWIMKER